jgi:hypothetical protein
LVRAGNVPEKGEQKLSDFHLERELRLQIEPKHKSLYSWAIQEVDAQGKPIGSDQIPWQWTLYFTATSRVLADDIEIESQFQGGETTPALLQGGETTPALPDIAQRQVIRVPLCPGSPWEHANYFDETTFSMFGTGRVIKSFQLEIHPNRRSRRTGTLQRVGLRILHERDRLQERDER